MIHVPEGDSYRTTARQDGPRGTYNDDLCANTGVWGGHGHFMPRTPFVRHTNLRTNEGALGPEGSFDMVTSNAVWVK